MVPSGLRSKKQPSSFSSSWMRRIAPLTSVHARSWSGSHAPPTIVSMKCRSIESPGASAALYPPWTMRVQPHFPSRPFTAMVIDSAGLAACACSAANRPAPPAPRIRMSVSMRRNTFNMSVGKDRLDRLASPLGGSERSERGGMFHSAFDAKRRQRAITARPGVGVDGRKQAAAVAVHGHRERAEIANPESPQAFGIELVQVDVLDRLDPRRFQRRGPADDRKV